MFFSVSVKYEERKYFFFYASITKIYWNNIGNVYKKIGKYDEALKNPEILFNKILFFDLIWYCLNLVMSAKDEDVHYIIAKLLNI